MTGLSHKEGGDSSEERETPPTVGAIRHLSFSPAGNIMVPIEVNGCPTMAVIDTAAQATVMSQRLAAKISPGLKYEARVNLKGPDEGATIPAKFCNRVEIQLGQHSYNWHLFVAPIRDDFILGLDFMVNYGMDVRVTDKCATIGQEEIPVSIDAPTDKDHCQIARILADKSYTIPARCAKTIEVSAPPMTKGSTQVFEPYERGNLFMLNSVYQEGGKIPITILNFTDQATKLQKGDVLGVTCESGNPEDLEVPEEQREKIPIVIRNINVSESTNTFPAIKSRAFHKVSGSLPEHLRDLFYRSSKHISFVQSLELANLLAEFATTFSTDDTDLGKFTEVYHWIPTGNAKAVKQFMRRTPLHFQKDEKANLDKMINSGVIQESNSEWASPVCLVRKKCGGVRWCVDMRALNAVTVKDSYPLPRIEECLDTLHGAQYFNSMDLASGYWQIEIAPEDRHKTAFLTRYGLYEHVRMAFGLCNAPATFQRAMQLVLRGLLWEIALAYLDDVISVGDDFQDSLANLRTVLLRFRKYNLKLKPQKCAFMQKTVLFLGHLVSPDGVAVNPANVEAIKSWALPETRKELESFLGFVNYHRNHIKDCAALSDCLYKVAASVKRGRVELQEEHRQAFEQLKQALINAPVLPYPDPECTFILDCDASDSAIGCELSQVVDGQEKVIAYGSYALCREQRNYCTTRKELLAVVRFTRQFRHYLLGRKFICRTDHNSLTWLMRFQNVEGQLARWLEELSQYHMEIVHRPGKKHVNADALSRLPREEGACPNYSSRELLESLPCFKEASCAYCTRMHDKWKDFAEDVDYVVPLSIRRVSAEELDQVHKDLDPSGLVPSYDSKELRDKQLQDPDLADVITWLESGVEPSQADLGLSSGSTKHYWQLKSQLRLKKGVLFYQWEDPLEPALLLVVPQVLKPEVLQHCHDTRDAGHTGERNTYLRLKHAFYWYRMRSDAENYVRTCAACSLSKKPQRYKKAPLKRYHAGSPLERVHVDILGPFNKSPQGNTVVLMVVDQFTKWVECYPLPDQTAERVAKVLVDEFFSRFGCPLSLHTDQGTNFTSSLFLEVCRLLQIAKTRTTAYRPQSNGQVERMNRTLLQMIRSLRLKNIKDWDRYLPQLAGAMRATINRNTGYTANMLMLGREVSKPAEILFGVAEANREPRTESEHAQHIAQVMREAHAAARQCLKQAQLRQKKDYDVAINTECYEPGDLVYLLDPRTKAGVSRKLQAIYSGPYLVTKALSPVLFRIKGRRREMVVHHDRIVPCLDRQVPLWMRKMRHRFLEAEGPEPEGEEEDEDNRDPVSDMATLYPEEELPSGDSESASESGSSSGDDTEEETSAKLSSGDSDSASESESESSSGDDYEEEAAPSVQRSRAGRASRPSAWLKDYVR